MFVTAASSAALADNDTVLRFDTPVQIDGEARFDRDSPLQPNASSFRIREANTLSSDSGERWALVPWRTGMEASDCCRTTIW